MPRPNRSTWRSRPGRRVNRRRSSAAAAGPIMEIGTASTGTQSHGSNAITMNVPVGAAIGDTLVLVMAMNQQRDTVNGFTGATKVIPPSPSLGGNQVQVAVWKLTLTGAPPASYSITGDAVSYQRVMTLMCFRNLHALTFLDATTQWTANDTVGTSCQTSAITPASAGACVVAIGASHTESSWSLGTPNGFTQKASAAFDGSTDTRLIVATKLLAGTSPVTCPIFTAGASHYYRGVSLALKPAA